MKSKKFFLGSFFFYSMTGEWSNMVRIQINLTINLTIWAVREMINYKKWDKKGFYFKRFIIELSLKGNGKNYSWRNELFKMNEWRNI